MIVTPDSEKRRAIAQRVADAYKELPGVDSLAVGGSTARGNADELSDIEIWLTYSSLPDARARKEILDCIDESGQPLLAEELEGGMLRTETLVVSGVNVGIFPGTNETLLAVGTDMDTHLGKPSEKGLADFHDCLILYDPKGLYATVKSRLADYPIALGTNVIQRYLNEVCTICTVDIPRGLRNHAWMHLLSSRSAAQEALLRVVFVLNRDYFPRVKDAEWMLSSMQYLPKDFEPRMRHLAEMSSDAVQSEMLLALAHDLASLSTGVWPERLDEEIMGSLDSAIRAVSG